MAVWLAKFLGGGLLDRVLDTVDRKVAAGTDREKIKGDMIREHMRTRSDFMRAGGFMLMACFTLPAAFWFAAVCVYSVFWCAGCAYPQPWSIAALPPELSEHLHMILVALFGVTGLMPFSRR